MPLGVGVSEKDELLIGNVVIGKKLSSGVIKTVTGEI